MLNKCAGCFKPVTRGLDICITCNYNLASEALVSLDEANYLGLTQEVAEEIKYALYNNMTCIREKELRKIQTSILAKMIGKCADTAVYLGKKKFEDLDDMKVLLFDLELNRAFITNADVVIRISDLPLDTMDGIMREIPAYDYLSDRFIPNPLPFTVQELNAVFTDAFMFTVTLPISYILEKIFSSYKSPMERRSVYAVIDVGYGFFNGSLVIPRFNLDNKGRRLFGFPNDKTIYVSKDSKIGNAAIEPDTPYVGIPVASSGSSIFVNIYKKYGEFTSIGLYEANKSVVGDEFHIYDLDSYGMNDLIRFKLVSSVDKFPPEQPSIKMQAYKYFYPTVVEAEYLYNVLLLFKNFGYDFVNLHVKDPNLPVLLEGLNLRNAAEQPDIEVLMSIVAVGKDGRECEANVESSLITSTLRSC